MTVKRLTEHHLEFRSLKGDYTGSSESTLVKMPHCWKSHVVAHMDRHEILVLIADAQKLMNILADASSWARGLNLGLTHHLHPYFEYASSNGSDKACLFEPCCLLI